MGDSTWLCLVGCSVPFSTLLTYHSADFPSATFLQVCSKNKHKTLFGFFNDGGAAVSFVCRKENHNKPASLDTIITKIKCFFFLILFLNKNNAKCLTPAQHISVLSYKQSTLSLSVCFFSSSANFISLTFYVLFIFMLPLSQAYLLLTFFFLYPILSSAIDW